jgi:hypothetical protein
MASYRNSTNMQTQTTKDDKRYTYETNTNKTNNRILTQFTGTPCDMKLKIISNVSAIICLLKTSESLQAGFATVAQLAEG